MQNEIQRAVGVTSFDELYDAKFSESLKMQSLKVEKFQQGKKGQILVQNEIRAK